MNPTKEEIDKAIDDNADRYASTVAMFDSVRVVAKYTDGRSGFFGIAFGPLLKRLSDRIREQNVDKIRELMMKLPSTMTDSELLGEPMASDSDTWGEIMRLRRQVVTCRTQMVNVLGDQFSRDVKQQAIETLAADIIAEHRVGDYRGLYDGSDPSEEVMD